jgi:hydroxypyruvate isomerase
MNDAPPKDLRFAAHLGVRSTDTPLFLHSVGSADPVAQINYIATLGFAGVEDNGLMTRLPEQQMRIGQALTEHGLAMNSFVLGSCSGEWLYWGREDQTTRELLRDEIESALSAAQLSGGRTISVVSGDMAGMDRDRQLDAMARHLRELLPRVADQGVSLALEHISDKRVPGLLLRRLEDTLRLIDAVGHPALGLVFDTHHVTEMDGDLLATWARASAHATVVQLADHPDRNEPGCGTIDFTTFLSTLQRQDWRGLIELEFMPSQPGAAGEKAVLTRLQAITRQPTASPSLPPPKH